MKSHLYAEPVWAIMPGGSERATYRGATLDVWRLSRRGMGNDWRWSVVEIDDANGYYIASGGAYSLGCARGAAREACDRARERA